MSIFSNRAETATEEADVYVKAVLELLGEQDPLTVLAELTGKIESYLRELSQTELKKPEAPGKWSAVEVVQHLADSELVWAFRLRSVLAQNKARITGYDQDAWAKKLAYAEVDPELAFEQLRVLRSANLRLLRDLNEEELQRVGLHEERGEESVDYMTRLYAGHDLVHLRQLKRIRDTLRERQARADDD